MDLVENKFKIGGMTCSMCSKHVETAVRSITGVTDVNVSLVNNTMIVTHNNTISSSEIVKEVKKAGYSAKLISSENEIYSNKSDALKLIVEILLTFIIFVLNINVNNSNIFTNGSTQFFLTICISILNYKYFYKGFKNIFRNPTMDSLVAIGVTSSLILSSYNLYSALHFDKIVKVDLYFDTAAMIQTIIAIGKWIESKSKLKVSNTIHSLLSTVPKQALRIIGTVEEYIKVSELKYGDIIKIKPGEQIPADGVITEGCSSFNESMITGESIPVYKTVGANVYAGTLNYDGTVIVTVNASGEDTTIAKIVKLVNKAISTKAKLTRTVDTVSKYFVPTIITIAMFTFIGWMYLQSDVSFALMHSISVLMVSCPCALGLATPLSITIGLGIGAKNNILFKSSESLENLARIKALVFDKTGTVTEGKLAVLDVLPVQEIDKKDILTIIASCENNSEHPLAKAIVKYALEQGIAIKNAQNFNYTIGQGISAVIEDRKYFIGNEQYIQNNCELPNFDKFIPISDEKIILYLATKNKFLGGITLSDNIRSNIQETIVSLKNMGIEIYMLSGDRGSITKNIGNKIGILNAQCFGDLLPEDKVRCLSKIRERYGLTAMIGDGINDAPALAESDIGISISTGLDITKNSSDLILNRNDPTDLIKAIRLSKDVITNIYENLFWGFIYNIICIPISIGAFSVYGITLTPVVAATMMSISSICVITNASRLFRWKPNRTNH